MRGVRIGTGVNSSRLRPTDDGVLLWGFARSGTWYVSMPSRPRVLFAGERAPAMSSPIGPQVAMSLAGQPVYGAGVGGYAAFLYPPPLAQLFAPISLLPFPAAAWLWRGVELMALRVAAGRGGRRDRVALVAPMIAELDAANVHLILAAAVAQAVRHDARWVTPGAITKFASLAAIPLASGSIRGDSPRGPWSPRWHMCRFVRHCTALWYEYVRFVTSGVPVADSGWYNLGASIPWRSAGRHGGPDRAACDPLARLQASRPPSRCQCSGSTASASCWRPPLLRVRRSAVARMR